MGRPWSKSVDRWLEPWAWQIRRALCRERDHVDVLPDLTDADLKELGLPLGARKKIIKAAWLCWTRHPRRISGRAWPQRRQGWRAASSP
jgi:hypothetical protein